MRLKFRDHGRDQRGIIHIYARIRSFSEHRANHIHHWQRIGRISTRRGVHIHDSGNAHDIEEHVVLQLNKKKIMEHMRRMLHTPRE